MEPQEKSRLGNDCWVQLHLEEACLTPLAEYQVGVSVHNEPLFFEALQEICFQGFMNHFAADLKKIIIYKPQRRKPSAYFLRERDMNLGRILSRVLPAQTLDRPTTVRKASLKSVMPPVAQATSVLSLSLGRKVWILRKEGTGKYQTRGLPRKMHDPLLRLRQSRVTQAVPTRAWALGKSSSTGVAPAGELFRPPWGTSIALR